MQNFKDVTRQANGEREVLFSLSNLKQYFPVEGQKDANVKAVDGITLKIYKGETFGLVGESGCGKSTLGRVILRIYDPTDGRTLYYGRSIYDLSPRYVDKTYKDFYKLRDQVKDLEQRYEKRKAEYDALSEEEQFKQHGEYTALEKQYKDSFLNLTELVGGLYAVEKPDAELALLRKAFATGYKRAQTRLALEHWFGSYSEEIEAREPLADMKSRDKKKLDRYYALTDELHDYVRQLEEAKDKYKGDPEFDKYEEFYDTGIDLARLTYDEMRPLRRDMQLVFQDPYSSLNPRMTAGQIIGEGMDAHGIYADDSAAREQHIKDTMEICGLQAYMLYRYPHQFSGGQRQRIGIARSLALNPEFIVADEAVSALDVSIQSQIINLLSDLKEEKDLTYFFISHDLSVVKYISDRIGVMYLGTLVEMAPTEELFESPRHPYTEALLSAIPTTDPDSRDKEVTILEGDIPSPVNPPSGCKFHTRCPYMTDICVHIDPEWEEVSEGHFVACHHKLPPHSGQLFTTRLPEDFTSEFIETDEEEESEV